MFGFLKKIVVITIKNIISIFLVVAEQCLYRAKDFTASCSTLPARRLGVYQELGDDTASRAGPGWPKRYLIPRGVKFNN